MQPSHPSPSWVAARTWFHVHALGALAAEPAAADLAPDDVVHRLRDLLPWLDHAVDIGAGGLLLTPVFASATHGYDTVDPFTVDRRLGDDGDLQAVIDGCHERGLRILLDGVFNHVGRDHPSPEGFLRTNADGTPHTFEGHDILRSLDHRSPAVLEWAVAVATHWLERGIDGWRLDAAYAVPPAFWMAFSARVRERFPDTWLVGEVIHGDYAAFVEASGLDSVTQYELHKALWSSRVDANPHELAWALRRHVQLCATFTPLTFAGNHDVTRLASRLPDLDERAAALAVLMTVPGSPCTYYGDELGWTGVKEDRAGGDDAIRQPLPGWPPPASDDLDVHRALLAVRRDRPWLTTADLEITALDHRGLTYEVAAGDRALRVTLAFGDHPLVVDADTAFTAVGHGARWAIHERHPAQRG